MQSAVVFLVIFIIAVAAGLYIVAKFDLSGPKRFELGLTYLGAFAALILVYNVYEGLRFNEVLEKNRLAYNTLDNNLKIYLAPQQDLVSAFPEGFFLYASMNQDIDFGGDEPLQFDVAKRKEVELYFSIRIFQAAEDFLATAEYNVSGYYEWINSFLLWFQSPILQYNWNFLSAHFSRSARKFIGVLIEKSNLLVELRKKKGALTCDDYDTISDSFSLHNKIEKL